MATAKKASKTNKVNKNKVKDVRRKSNAGMIAGICCAVVAVVVIIIAVIAGNSGINDSYFKSDGSKYVFSFEQEETALSGDEAQYAPKKAHIVYEYKDDTITGVKVYYEYDNDDAAKEALEYAKENQSESSYKEITTNGKYIVITMDESEYEGVSASDIKAQIEAYESSKNMNLDDTATDEATTEDAETTTENTDIEE